MIRFRPLTTPTMWTVPGLVLLVGLGIWQVQRLHEKEALLQAIAERIDRPPVPLNDVLRLPLPQMEWRAVQVHGRFLNDKEVYLYATEFDLGPGVHVITPLMQDDGATVLIDRGFVPEARRDPSTRPESLVPGDVTVSGIVRLSGERNIFTPAVDTQRHVWFWRDPQGISQQLGLTLEAPIVIAAGGKRDSSELPIFPGYRVDIPNNHLQYALTWFGLALALLGVYLVYHHSRGRLSFGR